jgi:Tol biopolymer transport system component
MTRTVRIAGLRFSVLALAVVAVVAGSAPSAQATPPGNPGPIAFQRFIDPQDEESAQIFTVARPGAKPRKLTSGGTAVNADYSPDGERIVFERRNGGRSPDSLFTMGSDGSSQTRLPTTCSAPTCLGDSAPAWSPDGNRLVFERAFGPIVNDTAAGLDLVTANADGSNEQVILHYRSLEAQGQEPHDAQWSPDGTRIAVMILNTKAKPRNASAIYVLNADGSGLHRLTPIRLNAGNPDWSPDGKRIAFNSSYEGQAAVELYTVRADGSGLRRLRHESKRSYSFDPVWSPDGRRLAFVHGAGRQVPHIWTMKKNGTRLRQMTNGRRPDGGPDWGSQ